MGSDPNFSSAMGSGGDLRDRDFVVGSLALDSLEDLLPVDRNFARRVDSEAYLIAFDTEHGDSDVVANDHRFPNPPGQDQHSQTPSRTSGVRWLKPACSLLLARPAFLN
jgi:hypothetical protein